jgi:hypothetical protein
MRTAEESCEDILGECKAGEREKKKVEMKIQGRFLRQHMIFETFCKRIAVPAVIIARLLEFRAVRCFVQSLVHFMIAATVGTRMHRPTIL